MPAGTSWPKYIIFCVAAAVTMLTGSQMVHQYYNPLKDLNDFVENERIRLQIKKQ